MLKIELINQSSNKETKDLIKIWKLDQSNWIGV